MRLGWIIKTLALGAVLLALQACAPAAIDAPEAMARGHTVYLVRHAEKAAEGDDPDLTPEGLARAERLSEMLDEAGIEIVWSTDYRRTMATAGPLASRLGLDVTAYDASDLPGFAILVEEAGKTAIVVGHSNTTPPLSALLGGEPGDPIDEAGEYDRLYVLTGVGTGAVETEIKRFGAPYEPSAD